MPSSPCTQLVPPRPPLFPYTTLFRSDPHGRVALRYGHHRPDRHVISDRPAGRTGDAAQLAGRTASLVVAAAQAVARAHVTLPDSATRDRKSTRLNSSHLGTSYAVFSLHAARSAATATLSLHDALPI